MKKKAPRKKAGTSLYRKKPLTLRLSKAARFGKRGKQSRAKAHFATVAFQDMPAPAAAPVVKPRTAPPKITVRLTSARPARPSRAVLSRVAAIGPIGPRLAEALRGLAGATRTAPMGMARLALSLMAEVAEPVLPLVLSVPPVAPAEGERWMGYKQRLADQLGALADRMRSEAGLLCAPLHAANALQCRGTPGQIRAAAAQAGLRMIEFDPLVKVVLLDDVAGDADFAGCRQRHPQLTGTGVRVAVLDSGIDLQHPYLRVTASVSTCGEPDAIPGLHGTHVAGCLASRDTVYGGIAPDVDLLNIKVLDSQGRGQTTYISAGMDAALDQNADVICLSLGYNHLPSWSQGGHGWTCPDGQCPLCTAVNNAFLLENVPVVVAAGNFHAEAEFLRQSGQGGVFDTELSCPGQAANAITVGAVTKRTFITAPFSSRGPTADGAAKPDLAADGVNIMSTTPAPRDATGAVIPASARANLTTRLSGTSMAAPLVAGAAALLVQQQRNAGQPRNARAIRAELLARCVQALPGKPPEEVGVGRLTLAGL